MFFVKTLPCSQKTISVLIYFIGLAGIHLLLQDPQQSIHFYREVLQLSARFSGDNSEAKITVDKLLIIHAMYNLSEVLDSHQPNHQTLRDETVRTDCLKLEKEYMEKFITEVSFRKNFLTLVSSNGDPCNSKGKYIQVSWIVLKLHIAMIQNLLFLFDPLLR